jgi:diguanylate cyclase (GGDEF)-like protein
MHIELHLDIITLSFITAFCAYLCGIAMLVVGLKEKTYSGILTYAFGLFTLGSGFVLLSLSYGEITPPLIPSHQITPPLITSFIGLILVVISFIMLNWGLAVFRQVSLRYVYLGSLFAIILVGVFYYYICYVPSITKRIIWISLFISIQSTFCVLDLFRGHTRELLISQIFTATPFICASIFFMSRVILTFNTNIFSFIDAGTLHQLPYLIISMLVIMSSFGLQWLISSRLHQTVEVQAKTDALTTLYNRRCLNQIASYEIARAKQENIPFSVILIDIDYFKKVNDKYGHQKGDIVLATIGKILRESIRSNDIAIRYGGEEFLILLPRTTQDQGIIVAEKIRETIENTVFDCKTNLKATASFGIASFQIEDTWDTVTKRSDEALYEAKSQGRNRVVRA